MRTITVYNKEETYEYSGPKHNASVAPNGALVISRTVPNVMAGKTGSAQTEKVLGMFHPAHWERFEINDE